ncbi:MAG: ABC transporter ATP-binding protein [Planctomycetales bacterium]|nr:ABC transporter ATP-binding protein [Planctomycetales bacterium]
MSGPVKERETMLELRRVYRDFGSLRAVNDVSFKVGKGEVFGYIGPNGAGKTTSMRIVATLDLPTYGDAFVDGFSVINDPDRVRRRLGFMPDYFGTYHNMSCHEYLDFFARSYGLKGAHRLDALDRVMAFTGLDAMAHKPVRGLSKGMKQRLCLGRSMIHDPAVLILDEPAAGLDPRARIELRDMVRQLASGGTTILVSSHILTELAEICDRVAIIERGSLVAIGTVDEIRHGHLVSGADTPEFEVRVRVKGGAAELETWLIAREEVIDTQLDGELLTFKHIATRDHEVALLRELVEAGFPIAEFTRKDVSLEAVFLQVTKGQVQ